MRVRAWVARRTPRWVWPVFELVTAGAALVTAGWVWWLAWSPVLAAGVPLLAVWPPLIALPVGALGRLALELPREVARYCNRRDALLNRWCSSDG